METQKFNWTAKRKQIARAAILEDYNFYEIKPLKFLKGVQFFSNGTARKIGMAHDYTFTF